MNWWISIFQRHTGVRYRADSFSSTGQSIYQLEADQTQANWRSPWVNFPLERRLCIVWPVWCKHFVPCFLGCGSGKQWPKPWLFTLCMKGMPTPDKYIFVRKPWNKGQRMSRFFFFGFGRFPAIALLGGKGSLLAEVATWWPHSHLIGRLGSGGLVVELRKLRCECWRSSGKVGFYTDTLNLRCKWYFWQVPSTSTITRGYQRAIDALVLLLGGFLMLSLVTSTAT